jgi:hypothetical protein
MLSKTKDIEDAVITELARRISYFTGREWLKGEGDATPRRHLHGRK